MAIRNKMYPAYLVFVLSKYLLKRINPISETRNGAILYFMGELKAWVRSFIIKNVKA
jgi:hypothetical protein